MKLRGTICQCFHTILLAALALWLVPTGRAQNIISLQPGVNKLRPNAANATFTVSIKIPSNASRVDFDFENTTSGSGITYSVTFSAFSLEPGQASSGNISCSQGPYQGSVSGLPLLINSTFSSQSLGAGSGTLYSCPVPPSDGITIAYTSTTPSTNLSAYAVVFTNSTGIQGITTGQIGASGTGFLDPCLDPTASKQSAVISTSASANLITASGTLQIFICGYSFALTGTTPTAQFAFGTGAACGTGTSNRTGTINPVTGSMVTGGTLQGSNNNTQNFCIIMGATSTAQGSVTFVQR